jgi:Trk K+ transport system NAD-binding subunit
MASSEHSLDEIKIQFNSVHCGQHLSAVQTTLPAPCRILGLIRDGKLIVAAENPTVLDQDLLIVVSLDPSLVPLLKVHLKKAKSSSWRTACNLLGELDESSAST